MVTMSILTNSRNGWLRNSKLIPSITLKLTAPQEEHLLLPVSQTNLLRPLRRKYRGYSILYYLCSIQKKVIDFCGISVE